MHNDGRLNALSPSVEQSDLQAIADKLTEAQKADLTTNWDAACDCDWGDVTTDISNFFERQEEAGFAQLVPVTEEDADSEFAWERGIELGGSMWKLTPRGLALKAHLETEHPRHD